MAGQNKIAIILDINFEEDIGGLMNWSWDRVIDFERYLLIW